MSRGRRMVERIVCNTPGGFDALFAEHSKTNLPFFTLFTGSKVNGRSWCPDCVNAEPVIDAALGEIEGGCKVLIVDVPREEYRKQDYEYRVHSKVQLRCVPTLIKWNNGKIVGRLNDSQSQNSGLVRELIEA